jgi:hypothetical protein
VVIAGWAAGLGLGCRHQIRASRNDASSRDGFNDLYSHQRCLILTLPVSAPYAGQDVPEHQESWAGGAINGRVDDAAGAAGAHQGRARRQAPHEQAPPPQGLWSTGRGHDHDQCIMLMNRLAGGSHVDRRRPDTEWALFRKPVAEAADPSASGFLRRLAEAHPCSAIPQAYAMLCA